MKLGIVFAALVFAGCAGESTEIKLAKLESLRKETHADLFRAKSECQALAIEFGGNRPAVKSCLETYRLSAEIAADTFSMIDKRIDELNKAECETILKKVKKNGGGFVPIVCSQSNRPFTYLNEEAK